MITELTNSQPFDPVRWIWLFALPVDFLFFDFIVFTISETLAYRGISTVTDFVSFWRVYKKSKDALKGPVFVITLLGGLTILITVSCIYRFNQQSELDTTQVFSVVTFIIFLFLLLLIALLPTVLPVSVLFLGHSSVRALLLLNKICLVMGSTLQVVYYVQNIELKEISGRAGMSLRTNANTDWKLSVEQAMKLAPTIVLDCTTITSAIIEEVALLCQHKLFTKVIFIGTSKDRDTLLKQAADNLPTYQMSLRPAYSEEELLHFLEESSYRALQRTKGVIGLIHKKKSKKRR